uniref:hypothetical protein n=1 Tax=Altererythrobacter segetis TaxID=1104773 RepID=UPI00140943CA|nr:hypothetical protein [Altererythrobacter segetis]
MSKVVIAMLLAACPFAASAEIMPRQEALTRCKVDFDIAYELIVPEPQAGQTEQQVIEALDPHTGNVARGLAELEVHAAAQLTPMWTHNTPADGVRLDAVEKGEEKELTDLYDKATNDAETKAMMDNVFDRVEACQKQFPDL